MLAGPTLKPALVEAPVLALIPGPMTHNIDIQAEAEAVVHGILLGTDTLVVGQKIFQVIKPTANANQCPRHMSKAAAALAISTIPSHHNRSFTFLNSHMNVNPPVSLLKAFYSTILKDAPFDLPAAQLRAAIYTPSSFI
ncbi:hypothetical protein EG329_001802 [Mollisiaceae sp. DMI_Dod_QoI]|nr:hypothetical protein EG329_001802 [Helotiales sp. DMI_Dod_QoI]